MKLKSSILFVVIVIVICIIAIARVTIVARRSEYLQKKQKLEEERGGAEEEKNLTGGDEYGETFIGDYLEERDIATEFKGEEVDDIIDSLEEERMKQILSEEMKRAATDELISAAFEKVLSDWSCLLSPVTVSDIDDAIADSSASSIFEKSFNVHLSSAISEKIEGVVDERIRRFRPFLRPTTFAVDITAYDNNRPQPEDVAGALDNSLNSAHAHDIFLPVFRYVSGDDFTAATSPGSSIEHGLHMLFEKSANMILKNREKYSVSITVFNNLGYGAVMYGTVYCNGPGVQFNTLKTEPGQSAFEVPVRGVKTFTWKINSARRPIFNKLFFSFLVHRTSS